ncbi:class I SAM-dependent methyltransferase [Mumia sp.]|uniref:class I SAM-dependent methyltransferase n=1 Tax=Mumia sp. TaxID=1965300 RepID=UPI002613663B|nr:class I SAM-dependent methyltransferase [Mumia sp.]MDD9349971.1 class I SAM-dependent methyltransferase [Mumia sp.]
MSRGYQIAYRCGVTPWEAAGDGGADQLAGLLTEEESRPQPWGCALDVGCGSGSHTIELGRRGWTAVGVDDVQRAIDRARARDGAEHARFVCADVTALADVELPGPVELFVDIGCFHGLGDEARAAYGTAMTAVASPTASFLLLAFAPGRRPLLPRGADERDLARALPAWELTGSCLADVSGMPRPLRSTTPRFYRLRRRP